MDRYLAAARAICDNYDLYEHRESDFDPVRDIAETIAEFDDMQQERDTLREQLATAQAEAAAMREALQYKDSSGKHSVYSYIKQHTSDFKAFGNTPETIAWATKLVDRLDKATSGTAGRELFDDMQRKDELIRELENARKISSEAYEKISEAHDRLWRKCKTTKLAYVETLRGKIDPAWFGEQSPVWRYRGHVHGALWRTCDGKMIEYGGKGLGIWDKSTCYRDWNDLLNNTATYPCDEHGKRLSDGGAK